MSLALEPPTAAEGQEAVGRGKASRLGGRATWLAALIGLGILAVLLKEVAWAAKYPAAWVMPIRLWVTEFFDWLGYRADFGLFTFRDLTRALSWLLEWPLALAESLFHSGFPAVGLGAIPWLTLTGLAAIVGHHAGGRRTALVAGGCVFYLALFGVWEASMETFSLVAVTVPVAAAAGLLLGIWMAKDRRVETAVTPLLDIGQSMPHFAYLVPVVVLFGFGQVPALIATAIFAVPPMVRCTILGIRQVPSDVLEAGRMAGCTPVQMLWKVEVPAARPTVMIGLNQVIMQTLAMAVICSLIGASGLGHNLLLSLNSLKMGAALEQGIAIVVIAIALDRVSQAYARKRPVHVERAWPWWRRHPHLTLFLGFGLGSLFLAAAIPAFAVPPESWTVTTAPLWDGLVDWISLNLYEPLQGFRNFFLLNILIPWRNAFQWLPWPVVVAFLGFMGWRIGGWRLALLVAALTFFPALTGFWRPAVTTTYMNGSAVVICILIGFPLGLWAAKSDRAEGPIMAVCDTMQTFPSFIYLIPVVMLFKVGDVAAVMAVILYAMVPMIRYTNHGLRAVPHETLEASIAAGTTPTQRLIKVELPLAFPQIMLGVNQTIMMGLFMVAITALIGTKDLGQEINKARSDADTGRALVAGLCIAFQGITADRLIQTWARRRRRELGLE